MSSSGMYSGPIKLVLFDVDGTRAWIQQSRRARRIFRRADSRDATTPVTAIAMYTHGSLRAGSRAKKRASRAVSRMP